MFCYFYKSNAFSFFGGAKKESAIAWSRGSALFWSLRPKFTPCDRVRSPDHRSGQKKSRPNFDQKSVGSCPTFFDKKWSSPSAPKCAQACLRKFFRTAKKYASQSPERKSYKKACKNPFINLTKVIECGVI